MYNAAVIGDKDSVYAFSALGLSVFCTDDAEEAEKIINRLAKSDFGIIYITEGLADKIPECIDKYRYMSVPAIILIPGINGNTGAGLENLNLSVEKAVGSNILK